MRDKSKELKTLREGEKRKMTRCFGLLLLSSAVFFFGYLKSCGIKRENEIEDGFMLLVTHIKEQLSVASLPLGEIYKSFNNKALLSSGFLFELTNGTHDAFYDAMCHKGKELLKNEKLYSAVRELSERIGKSPLHLEGAKLCETCLFLMKEEISFTRPKDKTKRELYFKLSFVFAVFIFLMFI